MREYPAVREHSSVREHLAVRASGHGTVDVSGRKRRPPVESPELTGWPALSSRGRVAEHRPRCAWSLKAACHERRASSEVSSANRDATTFALTVSRAERRIFDSFVAKLDRPAGAVRGDRFRRPSVFHGAIALATTRSSRVGAIGRRWGKFKTSSGPTSDRRSHRF
jgi:hypothetical protein